MLTIDVPPLELFEVQLQHRHAVKKGGRPRKESAEEPLVVSLGRPQVQRVTAELAGSDEALKSFLASEKDFRYHLLHFACSFDPDSDIRKAWLRAGLRSPGSDESPIAWSMDPVRRGSKTTVQQKVVLGTSLKFADIGANFGKDTTVTTEVEKPFIEAYHELRSDPYWAFTSTDTAPLRGSHRLSMVVKAPAGRAAKVDVTMRATVQRKKFGLIPYEVPEEAEPYLSVRLD